MGSMGAGGTTWTAMGNMGGTWAAMRGTTWTAMGSMGAGGRPARGTTWTVAWQDPLGQGRGGEASMDSGGTTWAAIRSMGARGTARAVGRMGAGGTTSTAMVDVLERLTCQKKTLRTRKLRKTMLPTGGSGTPLIGEARCTEVGCSCGGRLAC